MNAVLINKTDSIGGAAIACRRLYEALKTHSLSPTLLVQHRGTQCSNIATTTNSQLKEYYNLLLFLIERLTFLPYEKSPDVRFAFSIANTGENIARHPLITKADLLHLHWVNQGFLSMKGLEALFLLKKPMVWTLHDMWTFTGGCHYAGDCRRFQSECNFCPFLRFPSARDLSNKIFKRKKKLFAKLNPQRTAFVTCSHWLQTVAESSALLHGFRILTIPNPIDTTLFHPSNKAEARRSFGLPPDKKLILFGAGNIYDKRKGLNHLLEALRILRSMLDEQASSLEIVIFGKAKQPIEPLIPFQTHSLGIITDETILAQLYASCDVFVLPSTEDNLPNTIMESLSCGTPAVAFKIGGIPEIIEHGVNGYLATPFSASDLAHGIHSVLFSSSYTALSQHARQKVVHTYTMEAIAQRYIALYEELLQL